MPLKPKTHRQRLVESGRLPRHRLETRATAASRGYDADHRRWRLAILKRDPLCVLCAKRGVTRAATVADHVVPIALDAARRLDMTNGRGVCVDCHAKITGAYRRTGQNELPRSAEAKQ